jgi:hypothetical protein
MAGGPGLDRGALAHLDRRIEVPPEHPARRPGCRPAERHVSTWQQDQAGIRQLGDGRVPDGAASQMSNVRRIGEVSKQGGSILDGTAPDRPKGRRADRRDDEAACLGQGCEPRHESETIPNGHVKPALL